MTSSVETYVEVEMPVKLVIGTLIAPSIAILLEKVATKGLPVMLPIDEPSKVLSTDDMLTTARLLVATSFNMMLGAVVVEAILVASLAVEELVAIKLEESPEETLLDGLLVTLSTDEMLMALVDKGLATVLPIDTLIEDLDTEELVSATEGLVVVLSTDALVEELVAIELASEEKANERLAIGELTSEEIATEELGVVLAIDALIEELVSEELVTEELATEELGVVLAVDALIEELVTIELAAKGLLEVLSTNEPVVELPIGGVSMAFTNDELLKELAAVKLLVASAIDKVFHDAAGEVVLGMLSIDRLLGKLGTEEIVVISRDESLGELVTWELPEALSTNVLLSDLVAEGMFVALSEKEVLVIVSSDALLGVLIADDEPVGLRLEGLVEEPIVSDSIAELLGMLITIELLSVGLGERMMGRVSTEDVIAEHD
jgi:hypothetical protein